MQPNGICDVSMSPGGVAVITGSVANLPPVNQQLNLPPAACWYGGAAGLGVGAAGVAVEGTAAVVLGWAGVVVGAVLIMGCP